MCVVALAWRVHPDWPLILIGNRDEFHARPSAPLAIWDDPSGIVGGRDLQAGGTWLGVHPSGRRIVVVTNVRGTAPDPSKNSRGALVVDLLRGDGLFAAPTAKDLDGFNAFNLFAVDLQGPDQARLLTNRPIPQILSLAPGIHALANEAIDQPCPRAARLQKIVADHIAAGGAPEALLDALKAQDDPALFLHGDIYGTRASTLIMVAQDGRVHMAERRYAAAGRAVGDTTLDFMLG